MSKSLKVERGFVARPQSPCDCGMVHRGEPTIDVDGKTFDVMAKTRSIHDAKWVLNKASTAERFITCTGEQRAALPRPSLRNVHRALTHTTASVTSDMARTRELASWRAANVSSLVPLRTQLVCIMAVFLTIAMPIAIITSSFAYAAVLGASIVSVTVAGRLLVVAARCVRARLTLRAWVRGLLGKRKIWAPYLSEPRCFGQEHEFFALLRPQPSAWEACRITMTRRTMAAMSRLESPPIEPDIDPVDEAGDILWVIATIDDDPASAKQLRQELSTRIQSFEAYAAAHDNMCQSIRDNIGDAETLERSFDIDQSIILTVDRRERLASAIDGVSRVSGIHDQS